MRIDLNSAATASGSQVEKSTSSRFAPASAASSNKAEFLESDMSVGKLTAAAWNSPEVRTEKVQAIQSQLASGSYQISPAQVATSMLEQMRVRTS